MSNVVPDDWKTVNLPDVCYFQEGPGLRRWQYRAEGYPFINIRCIKQGYLDLENVQYISREEAEEKYQHFFLNEGDYVLSSSGTLGRMAQIKKSDLPIMLNTSVIRFRSIDEERLVSSFLPHYLLSQEFVDQITEESQGSAQVNFGPTHLKLVECRLPPKLEQQKIASILTSVDDVIEKTESQINKLTDLKKSMMQELLTKGIDHREFKDSSLGRIPVEWEDVTIESVLENIIDYRGKSPPKSEKGIPLITAKNIRQGYIEQEPREFIFDDQFDSWMIRGIPKEGDVFITTEAPLGNVARVPNYKFAIGQRVLTLRPTDIITTDYLFYVMQGEYFKEQLALQSTGSTVAGIKQSTFKKIRLSIPSVEEQHKITSPLNSLNQNIDTISVKLEHYLNLKKALMQDLLTGKVRVNV